MKDFYAVGVQIKKCYKVNLDTNQLEIVILTVLLVQLFKIDEHLKTNTNKA